MKHFSVIQNDIEIAGFSDKKEAIKYASTITGCVKVTLNNNIIYTKK